MSQRPSALRSPAAWCRFLLTAAVGVGLDLWSKSLAFSQLSPGATCRFIPGWLEFEIVENRGAVFGLGQGQRYLFIFCSFVAIVFLFYLFSISERKRGFQILIGMLLAGVVGNLYDRMVLGYVRDMIHALPMFPNFFIWRFNVADSLLCTGVGLMVIYNFWPTGQDDPSTSPDGVQS